MQSPWHGAPRRQTTYFVASGVMNKEAREIVSKMQGQASSSNCRTRRNDVIVSRKLLSMRRTNLAFAESRPGAKQTINYDHVKHTGPVGFEPTTYWLRANHSDRPELRARITKGEARLYYNCQLTLINLFKKRSQVYIKEKPPNFPILTS